MTSEPVKKEERITKSKALTEFGIKSKVLDNIDYDEVVNPHYKSGPPMRLYSLGKILKLAEDPKNLKKTFLDKELGMKMSEAQKTAHKKKIDEAVKYVTDNLKFWPHPKGKELYDEAYKAYQIFFASERNRKEAMPPGLNGIVSHVRHEYTNYEFLLAKSSELCKCRYRDVHDALQFGINMEIESELLTDDELQEMIDSRHQF